MTACGTLFEGEMSVAHLRNFVLISEWVASAGGGGRKKKGGTAMTRTRRADLGVVGGGKGQSSVDGGRQRGGLGFGWNGMERTRLFDQNV